MKTHIQEPYLDPSSDNPCNGEIRNEVETDTIEVIIIVNGKGECHGKKEIPLENTKDCIDSMTSEHKHYSI